MNNESMEAKERLARCRCGHTTAYHSLYMGEHGAGMCCADGCGCEGFELASSRLPARVEELDKPLPERVEHNLGILKSLRPSPIPSATASEEVDTEIGHTTLELGKIGSILFREAEPESASEDVGLPELAPTEADFNFACDYFNKTDGRAIRRNNPVHRSNAKAINEIVRIAEVHYLERQLLEARKEIVRLTNEISVYEMHLRAAEKVLGHSQTSARPLCATAQEWVERAEKAEAALAQRDEEVARLGKLISGLDDVILGYKRIAEPAIKADKDIQQHVATLEAEIARLKGEPK